MIHEELVEFFLLTVLFTLLALYTGVFKQRTLTRFVINHLLALTAGLIIAGGVYKYGKKY